MSTEPGEDFLAALEPVHVARTEEELEAVYRFRYTVYVEELARKLGSADHDRRWVHDPEDDASHTTHLYTSSAAGVDGVVRLRHWQPGEVPDKDWRAFSMDRFPGLRDLGTTEMGRLMVRPDQRGQLKLVALACAGYELSAGQWGLDVAFANCAAGLVRHYRKLGMRRYAGRLVPTPDGVEVPLVMFLSDEEQYRASGPFFSLLVPARTSSPNPQPTSRTALPAATPRTASRRRSPAAIAAIPVTAVR